VGGIRNCHVTKYWRFKSVGKERVLRNSIEEKGKESNSEGKGWGFGTSEPGCLGLQGEQVHKLIGEGFVDWVNCLGGEIIQRRKRFFFIKLMGEGGGYDQCLSVEKTKKGGGN